MNKKNPISLGICAKISEYIKSLSLFLAGAFLFINIADVIVSVFFRYFLRSSLVWTEEVARFNLIYSVMFGSVAALSYGEHVSISMVREYLPPTIRTIIKWIIHLLIVTIMSYLTYLGIIYALDARKFTTLALGIPKAIPMFAIPIGMGLFLLQYILLNIIDEFRK